MLCHCAAVHEQVARDVEAREAELAATEEAMLREQAAQCEAAAARGAEAQAAVSRLQAEAAHQLALEEERRGELLRAKREADDELREAQARAPAARPLCRRTARLSGHALARRRPSLTHPLIHWPMPSYFPLFAD